MTEEKTVKKARTKTPHHEVRGPQPPKKQGLVVALKVFLMLVWVAAAIIVSQFIMGNLLTIFVDIDELDQPVWSGVFAALSYIMALLIIILPLKIIRGTKEREPLGLKGLPTWPDIGLAPIGFVVYFLLAAGLLWVFSLFPWFDAEQAQDVGFNVLNSGFDRVVAFITLVVMAPIAEEVIFRGWLYGKVRSQLLNKVSDRASMIISIILVSLLFAALHGQWNVGVNVFAMSIVLCGMREITGTIYSGILLHMLKNGLAFYALYILGIG